MPSLPILTIVFSAFIGVFRNLGTLARAGFIPFAVGLVLTTIENQTDGGFLMMLLFGALSAPFYAVFVVACHRVFLLGPDALTNPWSLYWTSRETAFLGWSLLLGIAGYLIALGLGVVSLMAPDTVLGYDSKWLPTAIILVGTTWFFARFAMVLPASALGKRVILSNSWYLTANNGVRLTIALLAVLLIVWSLVVFIAKLWPQLSMQVAVMIVSILAMFLIAVQAAVLSRSYRILTEEDYSAKAP